LIPESLREKEEGRMVERADVGKSERKSEGGKEREIKKKKVGEWWADKPDGEPKARR
jgi:hypothetical protein